MSLQERRLMYTPYVRRIQIYIDEEVDEALTREAHKAGTSKAALIRAAVDEKVKGLPAVEKDPVSSLIGAVDCDPAPVDEVVYET